MRLFRNRGWKRSSLCLLLTAIALLSSCATLDPLTDPKKQEEVREQVTTEQKIVYPKVTKPLTWEQIHALPIANSTMNEDQLRQLVVDYMRLQLTFEWTPPCDMDYILPAVEVSKSFDQGTVYGGPPYRSFDANGNLYLWMEYLDPETGILDFGNYDNPYDLLGVLGNDCASSPFWAWNRVINSLTNYMDFENQCGFANVELTPKNNLIPVGGYESDPPGNWRKGDGTKAIWEQNGVEKMYACYAQIKPGDGMVHLYPNLTQKSGWSNHLQMCAALPTVVYKEDGSIDGEKSFVTILDQRSVLSPKQTDHGTVVYEGGIDAIFTFAELHRQYYIPFTFKEFLGTDPIEKGEATLTVSGDPFDYKTLLAGQIESNYAISHAKIRFFDDKGKTLYEYIARPVQLNTRSLSVSRVLIAAASSYVDSKTPFELTVQIGSGECITLLEGTLHK